MDIVCLSDTHGLHRSVEVPPGDVLLHAGDLTAHGVLDDVEDFAEWFGAQPHRTKIAIAGNHDFAFQDAPEDARRIFERSGIVYLEDELRVVDGLRIYGTPWTPVFQDWAFMLEPAAMAARLSSIPTGIDILLSHGPMAGVRDRVFSGVHAGCAELSKAVARTRPAFHVFGHIHECYGSETVELGEAYSVRCFNAASCTVDMRPVNPPITFAHGD